MIASIEFEEYQKCKSRNTVGILLFLDPILIAGVIFAFDPNIYLLGGLGLLNLLIIGILVLILNARFKTAIDERGISFGWSSFQKSIKKIEWPDVAYFDVTNWSDIKDNFRSGDNFKYGHRRTINKGLYLELKNNDKIFIGTRKPDEMKICIQNIPIKSNTF